MAGDEGAGLQDEIVRVTEGSEWRRRIAGFLMEAKADDALKPLIDEQIRLRMAELCRTEERYIEVTEALRSAGLSVRDGRVFFGNEPVESFLGEGLLNR